MQFPSGIIPKKILISFSTPIGNIRTRRASFESFGEHTPTATDDRRWWQIADITVFATSGTFTIDRQASFFGFTITATKFETALTTFFGHLETGRHQIGETDARARRRRRIGRHIASVRNILTHIVDREP